MNKTTYIALIVLGLLLGVTIAYAITEYLHLPGIGTIAEAKLTSSVTQFDWGIVTHTIPSKTLTFTLTNDGTEDTLPLNLTATWVTPTTAIGTITWDRETAIIAPTVAMVCQITFTLTDMTYTGPFEVDITIGAK